MRQNSPSHRVVAVSRSCALSTNGTAGLSCAVRYRIASVNRMGRDCVRRPTTTRPHRTLQLHRRCGHPSPPCRVVSFLCCRSRSRNGCQRWWRWRILARRQRLPLAQPSRSRALSVAQRERISFLHTTSSPLLAAHHILLCPIPPRLLSSSVPTASLWQPTLHPHHPGPWVTSLTRR